MGNANFSTLHHVDQETIDWMYNAYSPVFILSTGRSGSKFIAGLLDLSPQADSFHEPRPTLQYFSNYAFHHQDQPEILEKMINGARMELVLETLIQDKIYIESNQCLTFFAPILKGIFKNAKFIHVIRHPGDFVRSAIRKGWHKNDSIWESGRIRAEDANSWNKLDHVARLAWVWDATNRFIEKFKNNLPSTEIFTCKIEDLTTNWQKPRDLFSFAGVRQPTDSEISHFQKQRINEFRVGPNEPPNIQKIHQFPEYEDWDEEMKQSLSIYSKELARLYKYNL